MEDRTGKEGGSEGGSILWRWKWGGLREGIVRMRTGEGRKGRLGQPGMDK